MGDKSISPKYFIVTAISAILCEVSPEVDPFCMGKEKRCIWSKRQTKRKLERCPQASSILKSWGVLMQRTRSPFLMAYWGPLMGYCYPPSLPFSRHPPRNHRLENFILKDSAAAAALLCSVWGKDGSWTWAAGLHLITGTFWCLGLSCPKSGPHQNSPGTSSVCNGPTHPGTMP